MFTETEKTILGALPPKYKYIFRNRYGNLRICERFDGIDDYLPIPVFNHLFKNVMADGEPVRFREPILDDAEREYLKTILKPFHEKVGYVVKHRDNSEDIYSKEYLYIEIGDGDFTFPSFDSGKMYAGMELDKEYTLDELGITYD